MGAGIAAYACFATRTVGLAMFPALIAHAVFSRKLRLNNLISLGMALSLAAAQSVLMRSPASYLEQLHNLIAAVPQNTPRMLRIPITALMAASVQMARCGVSVLPCSTPKCDGTSSSRPIA